METQSSNDAQFFTLSDPEFSALSPEVHDARERQWFARSEFGLIALRHREVGSLLRDRRVRQGMYSWLDDNGITEGPLFELWKSGFFTMEGDEHRRLRRLVNPIFAPSVINALAPKFRDLTHDIIDEFGSQGKCEFVADFCAPYAARVLLRLLGVEDSDWRELQRMANDFGLALGVTIKTDLGKIESALAELYAFTDELVARRRREPGDDAISQLLTSVDQGGMTAQELRMIVVLLVFGGLDTTKNQLGMTLDLFMKHLDQWDRLANDPSLAEAAVNEALRVKPTILWISRRTTEPIEIGGLSIPADTTIQLFTEAAGTDPLVGGDLGFDIEAQRPNHFAFGAGPHHCVGQYLARVDMSEALPILARRLRNPRADGDLLFKPWTGLGGPIELPIAFEHRGRDAV